MHCERKIAQDLYYVGGSDRRLSLFENVFPIPNGVSYNAYVVLDEKTVLLDTVDKSVSGVFFENLESVLQGRKLDYLIVNHMEPDHCATMAELVLRYPDVKIVLNAKALAMVKQFFTFDIDARAHLVKENDTLCTGVHTFAFVMAPMVHWPEAMVTYDTYSKTLFSADAFGTFGALGGSIFADEVDFEHRYLDDARRYYTNIVGKYGTQVNALLKKAAGLDIRMLCPLHGPVWRKKLGWFIEKYLLWANYMPEENGVLIAYASVYGNTENAAQILAAKLCENGVTNIAMYDVSATHPSYIVAEAFRFSHLVFASTTYNAGIFCNMETLLLDLKAHNLQNRTVALIENGSWAPTAGGLMQQLICGMKNMTVLENRVTLKSSVKQEQYEGLCTMAQTLAQSLCKPAPDHSQKIDNNAMFSLSYGLYVLTAKEGAKDNGCIINTVMQITDSPKRVCFGVNKANYTHDMIVNTGVCNLSVLTQDASFDLFRRFGFCCGKDTDKFAGFAENINRSENGVLYITQATKACLSCKVVQTLDCGTHTLFIADITQAQTLSAAPAVTYAYYFANIKPKPQPAAEKKKGFVCKICGYVYEGDTLPADFICPLCKHGAEDFEPLS